MIPVTALFPFRFHLSLSFSSKKPIKHSREEGKLYPKESTLVTSYRYEIRVLLPQLNELYNPQISLGFFLHFFYSCLPLLKHLVIIPDAALSISPIPGLS